MKAEAQKVEAKLNRDGIVSDRALYLGKDGFTVAEHGDQEARFLLARPDALIPNSEVQRLGLSIEGGKVTQARDAARGGPEAAAGPTPQSAPWPPSTDTSGKDVGLDEPEWDPVANAPKSDFRHDPDAIKRALPTQGLVPLPGAAPEIREIEERETEQSIEMAHARAPMAGPNLVKEAELREEGRSGAKKTRKRSKK